MITDDLSNRRILILKSDQAPNILLSRLQKKCNKLIYVPIVKTLPNFRSSKVTQKFNRIDSYTLVIFISPNAVRYTFQFLDDQRMALPDHIEYFAVGLTSANLLSSRVKNVNYPKVNFSSEGLLELARFRDVINDRILIFRGGEGSNLLKESLVSQKAEVDYCDIYERQIDGDKLIEAKKNLKCCDCLIVYSAQVLHALGQLINIDNSHDWTELTLLVPSERLASIAMGLGYKTIKIAKNSSAECMEIALNDIFS